MRSDASLQRIPEALAQKARAAQRSLWISRLLRAFWPLWCLAAVTASLWLLGYFENAPWIWAHWTGIGLGVTAMALAVVGALTLRAPTHTEALRTLDEGLADRAASMLDEELAIGSGDGDAQRMWQAHRQRLEREAEAARAPSANLRLSAYDTWGLRYVAAMLLGVSFAYSKIGGGDRIAEFLDPSPAAAQAAVLTPGLEAWIAPPPYTGVAPIYLSEKSGSAVSVPTGSVLTLRASGVAEAPVLSGADAAFVEDAVGVYGLTLVLSEQADLTVAYREADLGAWALDIIPDLPPEIGVSEAPAPTATRALGFSFTAEDDYGVTAARATIVADRSGEADPLAEEIDPPIEMVLTPPAAMADEVLEQTVEQEFIEHPLAGSPVTMLLHAEDAAGHVAPSDAVSFILPARVFTEPMAKALIEQRRNLAWDHRKAWDALDLIEAVTDYPDDYFSDTTAFLATSTAKKRLTYALTEGRFFEERDDILDLLWKAAIRLEEGDLTNALEQLRAARRRLQDALERGASDEEIEQLMQELRQAMNEFLDEMARQAMRDAENGQQSEMRQQDGQPLTREDLERMLDQLEQTAKDGARDQAEQMLSMLGQMLENMQMSQSQGQGEGRSQQEQALQDMMRRQQELADETFQNLQNGENGQQQNRPGSQGQQGQQGQQPGQQGQNGEQGMGQAGRQGQQGQGRQPGAGQSQGQGNQLGQNGGQGTEGGGSERGGNGTLPGRQEGLRGELNDMLGQLPGEGARDALGNAEGEMGSARDSLREGDLNEALDRQARALDRLREGAQALAEEAARNGQQGQASPNGRQSGAETGQSADQFDPFGRLSRTIGPDDGLGVDVPGERARNRALEIQREIRRRQSEMDRPKVERDYLDRLQRRF